MRRLFILYDARCGLCSWARRWLQRQPAFLDLTFIPAGSGLESRLFPELARPGAPDELIVVSDEGGVYRGGDAWIMCLFATAEYRSWALRLAHPALRPLARRAFALLSKGRSRIARWLDLASEAEIAEVLERVDAPACELGVPAPNGQPRGAGHDAAAG